MANPTPRRVREIDVHIGERLRVAREAYNISQEVLANALGVTFQQVQKYEKGTNRISAGRLFEAAHALDQPIAFFFEGLKPPQAARAKHRQSSVPAAKR